jgi:GGDEF domain-containing protein
LISLWKTVTDLERLDVLQRVAIECYNLAISSSAQYAVEVDRAHALEFREHLLALEQKLADSLTPENLKECAASYRGELRDYRDHAHVRLEKLRQEVAAAADAMKAFAESVASTGATHEEQLEDELHRLQTLTKINDLDKIRGGIQAATGNIANSVDKLRRSNQLVIAQLQDEIRLLHQEIQAERRVLFTDPASGAWNRKKVETRIDELLRQDETFCVLLIALKNFKDLDQLHSKTVIEGALKATLMRFQEMLGEDVLIGRWQEEQFVALLPMDCPDVIALSREVTNRLTGNYSVQENGLARTVAIQVAAGIVDRRAGSDSTKFRARLEQYVQVLANPQP